MGFVFFVFGFIVLLSILLIHSFLHRAGGRYVEARTMWGVRCDAAEVDASIILGGEDFFLGFRVFPLVFPGFGEGGSYVWARTMWGVRCNAAEVDASII